MPFHPWRYLAEHHPDVHVDCRAVLQPGRMGTLLPGGHIALSKHLNQAERRCTLAHELMHLKRGPMPTDPVAAAREEAIVCDLTARWLITDRQLLRALQWTRHEIELAEELFVDVPTLRDRLRNLAWEEYVWLLAHLDSYGQASA